VAPDPHREAFHHAASGPWRTYAAYVDRVLDEALAARHQADAADLERLYRAPAASCAPFVDHHDPAAEWLVP
jgi:hypothetical protein